MTRRMEVPGMFYPNNFYGEAPGVDQQLFRQDPGGGAGGGNEPPPFEWFNGNGGGNMEVRPQPGLQQTAAAAVQQPQQMQPHDPQLYMGGHLPPFLQNYDSMGLMPTSTAAGGGLQLHPQQQQQLAAAAAMFPGPQLFQTCSAQVGNSLSIPSTSYLPFDPMGQLHHPSTSMPAAAAAQQQQLQQQHAANLAAAAAAAAAFHPYSASASDSSSQITTVLMAFRQGGEESEFVRKAIESLVKKLKDKRLELEALIQAVTSNGKTPTGCVTIQRSLDGRLQVAGRKGVPHVVYARIWRWPNVAKTELAKLPMCQITHENQDFICINPYHYERVVSNVGMIAQDQQRAAGDYGSFGSYGDEWMPQIPPSAAAAIQLPQQQLLQGLQTAGDAAEYKSSIFPSEVTSPAPPVMHRSHSIDLNRVQIPPAQHYPTHWCTINYFEHDTQVGESCKVRREMLSIVVDGGLDPQGERQGRFCVGAIPNVHRQAAVETVRMHIGSGVLFKQHQDGRVTMEVRSHKAVFVRAPYVDYVKHTPYATTTHKVQQGDGEITIFDLKWAYYEMSEQTASAKEAVVAQARAVAGLPVNHPGMQQMSDAVAGSGVDEMKRMFCTVGMSFVKGFGGKYDRKTIKECPCWIEVELHRPLQLLDQLLKRSYI